MTHNEMWAPVSVSEFEEVSRVLQAGYPQFENAGMFRSTLANTNEVFLILAGNLSAILRAINPKGFGVVASKRTHATLEVGALDHLTTSNFALTPRVVRSQAEQSVTTISGKDYIMFTKLPGAPIGSFSNLGALTPSLFQSYCHGAGQMSRLLRGYTPTPCLSGEETLVATCLDAHNRLANLALRLFGDAFTFIADLRSQLEQFFDETNSQLSELRFEDEPKQLVHRDLHLGNALFIGNALTGILDFDWLGLDCRLVDLAAILFMCCYQYGGTNDGTFNKSLIQQGLAAFREGFGESDYSPSDELAFLRAAMRGYGIFQFLFTLQFYVDNPPTKETFVDLQHFTRTICCNDFYTLLAA